MVTSFKLENLLRGNISMGNGVELVYVGERGRMRMNVEDDRLSVLPDDRILKILSFVGLKDAIRTSVLSPRWRHLWTSIPRLSFSSLDFRTIHKLSDFVNHVLSRRNKQVQLSSFKLYYCGPFGQEVAIRIMNHAFSLNVQQLNITCRFTYHSCSLFKANHGFTHSLPGSQTLKHLTLSWYSGVDYIILTSTREFSSLTTLRLYDITLYDGFLSMCPNLENLTLHCCKMNGSEVLSICHRRLSNLTLENRNYRAFTINVVTPQLKNLTISKYFGGYQISAPELSSLIIRGHCPYTFSTDGFHSLEKAELCLHSPRSLSSSDASTIIRLLQELHNVKLLSLSAEVIQLLNSSVELISRQPFLLANLKCVKIMVRHKHTNVYMSFEAITNYLLYGSPKATLTKVSTRLFIC
ncbi:putative F-box domain, leucine-rich repeat domain superfamily, F-box-like domain superfamily [Helianthus annuus]|nr:putative F-box domain, leucine-rich repeat domain superfamily, F-box-like domain superfamily [Helianthus annuus]